MKPNQKPENDESLCGVLREWVVDTPLPPHFKDQVWQRIARIETQPAPSFWAGLIRLVERALPRPGIAFSYVAALLVLGVAAGSLTAQIKSRQLNSTLSTRYVQSLDPYRMPTLQP